MRVRWILATLGGGALVAVATWLIVAFVGLAMTPVVSPLRGQPGEGEARDAYLGVAAVYEVDGEGRLVPEARDERTARTWDMFVRALTPEFVAEEVTGFRVSDERDADTYAYVWLDPDSATWELGANLAYAYNEELLVATLVHEHGHVLSLGGDQPDIRAFEERFWTAYGAEAPGPHSDDPEAGWAFYAAHPDDFVSSYAATNVVEDFAETYMTFVLEPRPDADSAVARKIGFFWDLPVYVAERERLRAEFSIE